MRSRDDLKTYRVTLECGVTLDIERLEQDPLFWTFAGRLDPADPKSFDLAVLKYLVHHLAGEQLLANMPATNGPADIYRTSIEPAADVSAPEDKENYVSERR